MSFFNVRQIKQTKKPCQCHWCGQIIEAGRPKTRTATVFEGDFQVTPFHPECYQALQEFMKAERTEYWPGFGEMKRGLNEPKH